MYKSFEFAKKMFPKLEFIPDNSTKDLERPDYYQIFYAKNYIGVIRKSYQPRNDSSKGLEIVDNLRELTKLSGGECSRLIEVLTNLGY